MDLTYSVTTDGIIIPPALARTIVDALGNSVFKRGLLLPVQKNILNGLHNLEYLPFYLEKIADLAEHCESLGYSREEFNAHPRKIGYESQVELLEKMRTEAEPDISNFLIRCRDAGVSAALREYFGVEVIVDHE